MESYDVVIVGAGPSGLKCAETLGKSGLTILIIDKKGKIGPKPCGGLMTKTGIEYINSDIGANKFENIKIHTVMRETDIEITGQPLYTINREALARSQLTRIKNMKNINLKKNTAVTKINKDYVIANGERIHFRYLVGADGSSSIVRKHLGLKSEKIGIGLHYVIPTKKYKDIELFFDSRFFGPWYAWILPYGNYVSIGTGYSPKILSGSRLLSNFHEWLKLKNIDVSNGKYEAHTLNSDFQGFHFGNIFLVGDAAGLVYSFTGEGIHPALVSGEEIAKKIMDEKYEIKMEDILQKKRLQYFITQFLIKIGPMRIIGHEAILLILKNKLLRSKTVKIFT